jgi:ribosomal protein L37E
MVVVRTTGEKSIFGEDCYRVDEEDGDCKKKYMSACLFGRPRSARQYKKAWQLKGDTWLLDRARPRK